MMQTGLTKPQVKMLTKAMRDGAFPCRQQWKTAGLLERRGLLVSGAYDRMYVTQAGLAALRAHRLARYNETGSMASILDLEEVDAALAEQAA